MRRSFELIQKKSPGRQVTVRLSWSHARKNQLMSAERSFKIIAEMIASYERIIELEKKLWKIVNNH